jgi:hypothetical protein
MELTLRKASAIQEVILTKINSIVINTVVSLNEFQDPKFVIDQAKNELLVALSNKVQLWDAFYEIRTELGKANSVSGVNSLLAELAKSEKLIQLYQAVAVKSSLQESLDVISGKLKKISTSNNESRYGYSESVSSGVMESIDEFTSHLNLLTKNKQSLNDKLLELNIKTRIKLTDKTVEVLTNFGIL